MQLSDFHVASTQIREKRSRFHKFVDDSDRPHDVIFRQRPYFLVPWWYMSLR